MTSEPELLSGEQPSGEGAGETRAERKERTRRAILDAGLTLAADSNLSAVSLRQVAKQVGVVPTAFYRHFDSLELLGLALVDESFRSLRSMLTDVWRHAPEYRDFIDGSLPIVAEHVRDNRAHYAFIARERVAGPPRVREAIGHEIEQTTRELASDIARSGAAEHYSSDDIGLLADLIVSFVVTMAERLVDDPDSEERTLAQARTQLRMLLVGALNWRSREGT
ncbi:TetR family transcriptional regulator [Nocardioides cavernae]|uniref:TetR family transcriptional regulator n=1 Tax=Nocardioides cavernae TaxID=1921566 RepID=A0ABR8NBG1_9ACTN|nr:TetR family transcriptional regulator [Nocardioides cavernae]MBD3925467.1 TetR family transcriptional regulator [Nocardioides cavernae]MBM7514154.1 AcrR family transcriptional regulator [Nocardioides cavernae]